MAHSGLLAFCTDPVVDRVARLAYQTAKRLFALEGTGVVIDDQEVLQCQTPLGDRLYLTATKQVMPHNYPHYIPQFQKHLPDAELVLVFNWHEGVEAPEKVITFHSNSDIPAGRFARVAPAHVRNILLAADRYRKELGLHDYRVLTEVAHWSGRISRQDPAQIEMWNTPVYDYEIGSSPECWENPTAVEVLLRAALHVFDEQPAFSTLLCVGGMHFQEDYVNAVLADHPQAPLSLGHIFHSKWMESSDYLGEVGTQRFEHCITTIDGVVQGIVFHQNIKGPYKTILRDIAERLRIPSFHHKKLRELGPDLLKA